MEHRAKIKQKKVSDYMIGKRDLRSNMYIKFDAHDVVIVLFRRCPVPTPFLCFYYASRQHARVDVDLEKSHQAQSHNCANGHSNGGRLASHRTRGVGR